MTDPIYTPLMNVPLTQFHVLDLPPPLKKHRLNRRPSSDCWCSEGGDADGANSASSPSLLVLSIPIPDCFGDREMELHSGIDENEIPRFRLHQRPSSSIECGVTGCDLDLDLKDEIKAMIGEPRHLLPKLWAPVPPHPTANQCGYVPIKRMATANQCGSVPIKRMANSFFHDAAETNNRRILSNRRQEGGAAFSVLVSESAAFAQDGRRRVCSSSENLNNSRADAVLRR